jgi:hypothetical protein
MNVILVLIFFNDDDDDNNNDNDDNCKNCYQNRNLKDVFIFFFFHFLFYRRRIDSLRFILLSSRRFRRNFSINSRTRFFESSRRECFVNSRNRRRRNSRRCFSINSLRQSRRRRQINSKTRISEFQILLSFISMKTTSFHFKKNRQNKSHSLKQINRTSNR